MWESRVAPLTGVLFAVLLISRFVVDGNTDFMPPEADIVAYLEDGPVRVMTAAYLGLLASGALLWFSGSLRKHLGTLDDDEGRLGSLAMGGGVATAAALAIGGAAIIAAAERVWVTGSIEPGAAATLFDLAGIVVGNGAPIGLGVLVGATGVAMLRSRHSPAWPGWASALIAIGLVSPFAWIVLAGALVWIPAMGIWIYRIESMKAPALVP